jgi:uncharacterized membrane protein
MTTLSFSIPRMRRLPLLRTEIDRVLAASMLFSCILVGLRILHTGRLTFLFMTWNLFLAYVPYAISTWLTARQTQRQAAGERLLRILLSLLWLLFIPNSFYILTDLYHLADGHRNSQVPEWFDLTLILSFAWNGLLLGVLSIRQMERLFIPPASVFHEWLFLYPVMWLNALGVYAGRYLRYNSWDIFSNPFQLLADIFGMIIHPWRNHYAWDMIFCFSILITLMYSLIKKGSAALA